MHILVNVRPYCNGFSVFRTGLGTRLHMYMYVPANHKSLAIMHSYVRTQVLTLGPVLQCTCISHFH